MATAKKKNQSKNASYYVKAFWKIFALTLGGFVLFFLFASWGLFGAMPSFEELEKSVLGTAEVKENNGSIKISLTPKNKTYKDPCKGCKKREVLCSSFLPFLY